MRGIVTIAFTILFTFIFFDTLFAATCVDNYRMFITHDTLPQRSLTLTHSGHNLYAQPLFI